MAPPLTEGRFGVIAVPFVRVMFSGEYESELGASSLMVMFTVAEAEPPELLAQTVYVVAVVCSTDGVPLMAPVEVLKERPVGTEGLISQDVMVPPLVDGRFGVIVVPFSSVMFSGEYEISLGACSLTVIDMVAEDSPPGLLAVMV